MLKKSMRDAITKQALEEIAFARISKQAKITNWHKNEDMYYSRKPLIVGDQRANVNLNEAQSFVTTYLSKINNPFDFKYTKGSDADLKPAMRVNAIKDKDSKAGFWDFKAMVARTQMIIYGRYIFEYHADSIDGVYKSHLSNVDVYQFLIDPSCGGIDMDDAFYLGRGNILKSKDQIEKGIKKGIYLRTEASQLISGTGNGAVESEEDRNAENRWFALLSENKVLQRPDQWKFFEWYTTFEGKRYYLLITEDAGLAIRVEPLKDLFKKETWPFFSVAAYPDLTEFWTPSPLDGVREALIAKAASINQMLDNGEAINRPMKAFAVDAIVNPALLKYRTDGLIPMKPGFDINKSIQFFPTTPITTAIDVYDKLDAIVNIQSGVTNAARGESTEDTLGIYEGNQANAADRFSLVGDSEAHGQYRFARLYLDGIDEHLTSAIAIEMIGPDGIEFEEVGKKEIKRRREFNIQVVTAGSEETLEREKKADKLKFLVAKKGDTNFNQKVIAEMEAGIVGFDTDEVKRMLDTSDYANAELMSEAARDIERLLDGEMIEPNDMANTAYQQKIVDYLKDEREYMIKNPRLQKAFFDYLAALEPIVIRNMAKQVNTTLQSRGMQSVQGMQNDAMIPGIGGAPAPEMAPDMSMAPEMMPAPAAPLPPIA